MSVMGSGTQRIQMWSGPRNISTTLMYSFRERLDTTVQDEPLYGYYLSHTGRRHPGDDEVMASQNNNGAEVIKDMLAFDETPVVFFKQMAKHLVGLDWSFLAECDNVILCRHPHDMLTSLQNQLPDATVADTGLEEQVNLVDAVVAKGGTPIVLEAATVLGNPEGVLRELCERLGLEFSEAMLSWPPGPKPEDGVWAKHWYASVQTSSGFRPYAAKEATLIPAVEPELAPAMELYEQLMPYVVAGS
jgi:hypothetical protein